MEERTTDFGYEKVSPEEKTERVREVFRSVAQNYDVMNDLMSLGLHRVWKKYTLHALALRKNQCVLDLAAGTGDLALSMSRAVGERGQVVMSDINDAMLAKGRERMIDNGCVGNIRYVQANGETLPFAEDTYDCVTMAFGLRNVTDKARCLDSIYRVLKPGGKLFVLEFSKPYAHLRPAYDAYSFGILPKLGKVIAKDEDSYRYLAESIRMHPDQETLRELFVSAGFGRCKYTNMTGGVVALHRGYKF